MSVELLVSSEALFDLRQILAQACPCHEHATTPALARAQVHVLLDALEDATTPPLRQAQAPLFGLVA